MRNKRTLAELAQLENLNPETITEYCYYDGCPTTFKRLAIDRRAKKETVRYYCVECLKPIDYPLVKEGKKVEW